MKSQDSYKNIFVSGTHSTRSFVTVLAKPSWQRIPIGRAHTWTSGLSIPAPRNGISIPRRATYNTTFPRTTPNTHLLHESLSRRREFRIISNGKLFSSLRQENNAHARYRVFSVFLLKIRIRMFFAGNSQLILGSKPLFLSRYHYCVQQTMELRM